MEDPALFKELEAELSGSNARQVLLKNLETMAADVMTPEVEDLLRQLRDSAGRMQNIQQNIEQRLVDYKQSISKDDDDEIDWTALGEALDDAQEELAELGEDIDADELDAMRLEAEAEAEDGADDEDDLSDDNGFRDDYGDAAAAAAADDDDDGEEEEDEDEDDKECSRLRREGGRDAKASAVAMAAAVGRAAAATSAEADDSADEAALNPDGDLWAMFDQANWQPGVWNAARLPRTPYDFATSEFWRRRYAPEIAEGIVYDWYDVDFGTFQRRVLEQELRVAPGAWVLQVGCGNSGWSRALAENGYCALSTDIDPALLAALTSSVDPPPAVPPLWAAVDALDMGVRPGIFDLVLDKGTFDALSCTRDAAGPSPVAVAAAAAHRALRPGGFLVVVTPAPEGILRHLLTGFTRVDGGPAGPAEGPLDDVTDGAAYGAYVAPAGEKRDGRVLLRSRTPEEMPGGRAEGEAEADAEAEAGAPAGGGLSQSLIPPGIMFRLTVLDKIAADTGAADTPSQGAEGIGGGAATDGGGDTTTAAGAERPHAPGGIEGTGAAAGAGAEGTEGVEGACPAGGSDCAAGASAVKKGEGNRSSSQAEQQQGADLSVHGPSVVILQKCH